MEYDKHVHEAIENEKEFNGMWDDLAAEVEALGVPVDIPYSFVNLPLFEGHESVMEFESECYRIREDEDWSEEDDAIMWHDELPLNEYIEEDYA